MHEGPHSEPACREIHNTSSFNCNLILLVLNKSIIDFFPTDQIFQRLKEAENDSEHLSAPAGFKPKLPGAEQLQNAENWR